MYWIGGKNCLLIDAGFVMRQSERQNALELIREKANEPYWGWSPEVSAIRNGVRAGRSTAARV